MVRYTDARREHQTPRAPNSPRDPAIDDRPRCRRIDWENENSDLHRTPKSALAATGVNPDRLRFLLPPINPPTIADAPRAIRRAHTAHRDAQFVHRLETIHTIFVDQETRCAHRD